MWKPKVPLQAVGDRLQIPTAAMVPRALISRAGSSTRVGVNPIRWVRSQRLANHRQQSTMRAQPVPHAALARYVGTTEDPPPRSA